MKYIITGASGFIGSALVDFLLEKYPKCQILNIDNLSYAALPGSNRKAEKSKRYKFEHMDICDSAEIMDIVEKYKPDAIYHLAAESNVDFSLDPIKAHRFVETNVLGTHNILQAVKKYKVPRLLQVSTDETFGEILEGSFYEDSPIAPRNPYAASKVGADAMVNSFIQSYDVDAVITKCTNNYGPKQDFSKFIPKSILRILEGEPVILNSKGEHIRSWINVKDHVRALDAVMNKGIKGKVYNVTGGEELSNYQMACLILKYFNKDPESNIIYGNLRIGDDIRYSVKSHYIEKETGYQSIYTLENSFLDVIDWYKNFYQTVYTK